MKKNFIQNDIFIGVLSKEEFIEIAKEMISLSTKEKQKIAIISIQNPRDDNRELFEPLKLHEYGDFIVSKFWDLENDMGELKAISDKESSILANFIADNGDKKFLIHCSTGVSRSAGVARAVECLVKYNGDYYDYVTGNLFSKQIKDYPRYHPNYTVMVKIIENSKIKVKNNG